MMIHFLRIRSTTTTSRISVVSVGVGVGVGVVVVIRCPRQAINTIRRRDINQRNRLGRMRDPPVPNIRQIIPYTRRLEQRRCDRGDRHPFPFPFLVDRSLAGQRRTDAVSELRKRWLGGGEGRGVERT